MIKSAAKAFVHFVAALFGAGAFLFGLAVNPVGQLLVAVVIFLLLALAMFRSCIAQAYPENVRLGYSGSCMTCHVSPTGGGVPNAYGRMAGEDLASWSTSGAGQFLGRVELPLRVAAGGDLRYIRIDTPTFKREFLMQADCELGLGLSNEVWVVGTYGRYGEHPDGTESRRHYLLWLPNEYVTVRAGRFYPAYGIMTSDHTVATRQALGFGEGRESYAAELGVHAPFGELFLTGTAAEGSSVAIGKDPPYQHTARAPGYLARASAFLGKYAQAGASYRLQTSLPDEPPEHTFGPFLALGLTRDIYLLTEGDRKLVAGARPLDVSFTELGAEVVRGLHVQATHEYQAGNRYGLGLTWYPVPHVEALARAKYQDGAWGTQLMLHLNW